MAIACATLGGGIARASSAAELGGIALGVSIGNAAALYPQGTVTKVGRISILRWNRPDGGHLTAYSDYLGNVWQIRFDGVLQERGTLQLPCGGDFDITGSHINYDVAAESLHCKRSSPSDNTYSLPDGSVTTAEFFGPGDRSLQSAVLSATGLPPTWPATPSAGQSNCDVPNREAGMLHRADLRLPSDAVKHGATGTLTPMRVLVLLGPDGLVKRASMWTSSGNDEFDDAAVAAVQQSTYRPKLSECAPTYGVYVFPYVVAQ
jgi:TonB family protein